MLFEPLRALRICDFNPFLAVMRCIEEISCFLAAECCFCASWAVRRRGMNVPFVVVGESASALGDRRVCVEGV